MIPLTNRSLLRRRDKLINSLQAFIDGLSLIILSVILINNQIGYLTPEYTLMLLLLLGILAIVFDQYGLYRRNLSFTSKVITLIKAWTLSFFILVFLAFVTKQGEYFSRVLIAKLYVCGLSVHVLFHLVFYHVQKSWLKHYVEHENAIIIGQGYLANYLAMKIKNNPWLGQKMVGTVTVESQISDDKYSLEEEPENVLGGIGDLESIIQKSEVSTVYIVTPLQNSKLLEDVYFTLLDNHISVHWIPDIFSLRLVNHSVSEIAGIPVLTLSESPLTGSRLIGKELEDKILSTLFLFFLSPLFMLIAIAVKLDSPGPIFFRQERAGWSGKSFFIWKFRSMYVHKPDEGVVKQAERGDSRITRVGAFLRRTSLDELPQLLNVFTGDMSLVGPRPHALQHDEEYSKRIFDYFARHQIKPGITGLAQVRGLRGETRDINQMLQRVESDIEYINNWSLWLDLTILLRTVTAFTGKNAY